MSVPTGPVDCGGPPGAPQAGGDLVARNPIPVEDLLDALEDRYTPADLGFECSVSTRERTDGAAADDGESAADQSGRD